MSIISTSYNENDLVSSTYWGSELEIDGKFFITVHAGKINILLPRSLSTPKIFKEMRSAKETALTIGNFTRDLPPIPRGSDGFEILFDDNSSQPFSMHSSLESFEQVRAVINLVSTTTKLQVWEYHKGSPRRRLSRICLVREGSLPNLKPI